ncbi:MAG: hypothetical protein AAFZ67_12905 [Planctomycetota bacterium]
MIGHLVFFSAVLLFIYLIAVVGNAWFSLSVIPSLQAMEPITPHKYQTRTQPFLRRMWSGSPPPPLPDEDKDCECFHGRLKGAADVYLLMMEVSSGTYLCEFNQAKMPKIALVTTLAADGSKSCWTCSAMQTTLFALGYSKAIMRFGPADIEQLGKEHGLLLERLEPDHVPTQLEGSFGQFLLNSLHAKNRELRSRRAWVFRLPFWNARALTRANKSVDKLPVPPSFLRAETL